MLSLTKTEMLLGSPLYMAPEQMRSSKYVDERSDIWALGAIAYELLTRRVPFEADTLLDLCFKVAQEGCPTVHELRPEVPTGLSDVVMRCLEKDPEARWDDIGALASALEAFAAPADRGSAARTIGILSAGVERARLRRSDPDARTSMAAPGAPASGGDGQRISDGRTTDPGGSKDPRRATDPSVGASEAPKPDTEERVVSGMATTERLTADEPSAPDAVPASSAWGTTNAAAVDGKKSRRGVFAVTALAAGLAALGLALAKGSSAPAATPTSTPIGAASSAQPVETSPPYVSALPPALRTASAAPPAPPAPSEAPPATHPSASALATPSSLAPTRDARTAPRSTSSHAPAAVATAPPRASASSKPPTSASAVTPKPPEPASSGGFIRVRE